MLDFRARTFLSACRTRNYTRTAEELSITQPAVSQHIAYLERHYGMKLFSYVGKRLDLTTAGELLYRALSGMAHDERLAEEALADLRTGRERLSFGVTLTVGEYLIARPLARYLSMHPHVDVRVEQAGTEVLLRRLREGEIDCALIEGYFDKHDLAWREFCMQELVGVCAPGTELSLGGPVGFEGLLERHILVREPGSGTRAVLEHALAERNLSLASFARMTEVSSLNIIKAFVAADVGISFLYEAAVREELEAGRLARIPLAGPSVDHAITFVHLAGSVFEERFERFFEELAALSRP